MYDCARRTPSKSLKRQMTSGQRENHTKRLTPFSPYDARWGLPPWKFLDGQMMCADIVEDSCEVMANDN